jgi:hypothetical protein
MDSKMIYSDGFQLTAGDFDRFKKIKPYAIFNIFQEVAANPEFATDCF